VKGCKIIGLILSTHLQAHVICNSFCYVLTIVVRLQFILIDGSNLEYKTLLLTSIDLLGATQPPVDEADIVISSWEAPHLSSPSSSEHRPSTDFPIPSDTRAIMVATRKVEYGKPSSCPRHEIRMTRTLSLCYLVRWPRDLFTAGGRFALPRPITCT
jgi:hypothetical protein